MKHERQNMILELIKQSDIHTQDDLVSALQAHGFQVTQATVSRDIKELGLRKESDAPGSTRYVVATGYTAVTPKNERERFAQMFVNSVLEIQYANNMIVIHTLSGSANAAAEAVDGMHWPEILGTMAGDNTIFAVIRRIDETPMVAERLKKLLRGD